MTTVIEEYWVRDFHQDWTGKRMAEMDWFLISSRDVSDRAPSWDYIEMDWQRERQRYLNEDDFYAFIDILKEWLK